MFQEKSEFDIMSQQTNLEVNLMQVEPEPVHKTHDLEPEKHAAVSLSSVTVDFGTGHRILEDFSLEVPASEFTVLIGRSGCGKTTVLNVLSGLVQPVGGTVRVLGDDAAKAQRRIGYMFARDALYPWRTALRNAELGLEIHGVPKSKRREAARSWLSVLGLAEHERHYPWQLSQGMRQRVALARTWASAPDLLLMDEPFAALDAQTRDSVRDDFISLWEKTRPTVLFVTHDLEEAVMIADRIIVMGDGKVLQDARIGIPRPRVPTSTQVQEIVADLKRLL